MFWCQTARSFNFLIQLTIFVHQRFLLFTNLVIHSLWFSFHSFNIEVCFVDYRVHEGFSQVSGRWMFPGLRRFSSELLLPGWPGCRYSTNRTPGIVEPDQWPWWEHYKSETEQDINATIIYIHYLPLVSPTTTCPYVLSHKHATA